MPKVKIKIIESFYSKKNTVNEKDLKFECGSPLVLQVYLTLNVKQLALVKSKRKAKGLSSLYTVKTGKSEKEIHMVKILTLKKDRLSCFRKWLGDFKNSEKLASHDVICYNSSRQLDEIGKSQ